MASKHEPEQLISMLRLEKSSLLTQESLEKIAAPELTERTDPGSIKARERQKEKEESPEPEEQQMPMALFSSGDEVIGYIKEFIDKRPNLHIDPPHLMAVLVKYYTSVNQGNKITYNELMHELLEYSSDKEEVFGTKPTEEDYTRRMEEAQRQLGVPVGAREGPNPTEEELLEKFGPRPEVKESI